MTDNFVGFAKSPKQSKTAQLEQYSTKFELILPVADAVRLISTADGVERWIGELVTPKAKWRFQLGAKIRFQDEQGEFGATFGAINLPHEIVLLTERFGEIRIGFGSPKSRRRFFAPRPSETSSGNLEITVSRMCEPSEADAWETATHALVARLGAIVRPHPAVDH